MTMRLAPARAERLRRAPLLALLAMAHLSLWWALNGRPLPAAPKGAARLSEVRLIAARVAPRPTASAPVAARAPRPAAAIARGTTTPPTPALVPTEPQPATEAAPTGAITPPPPRESLLDSEATRRALRQAARAPLLSERAASAMGDGAPLRPEDRLGQQMMQGATTDCLKGEYLGGGMGLLSLPFWALAEVRGKCRR